MSERGFMLTPRGLVAVPPEHRGDFPLWLRIPQIDTREVSPVVEDRIYTGHVLGRDLMLTPRQRRRLARSAGRRRARPVPGVLHWRARLYVPEGETPSREAMG